MLIRVQTWIFADKNEVSSVNRDQTFELTHLCRKLKLSKNAGAFGAEYKKRFNLNNDVINTEHMIKEDPV